MMFLRHTTVSLLGMALCLAPGHNAAAQAPPTMAEAEAVLADVGIRPVNLRAADRSGDGAIDLIVVANRGPDDFSANGDVSVVTRDAQEAWNATQTLSHPDLAAPFGLALHDVTENGLPDVIVGDAAGTDIFIFNGNPDGTFNEEANVFLAGPGVQDIDIGLIDSDNILDIVTANTGEHLPDGSFVIGASLLKGLGGGFFDAPDPEFPDLIGGGFSIAAVDLNDNGLLDIVTTKNVDFFSVMQNLGNGQFSDPSPETINNGYLKRAVMGDLDGDGREDVVAIRRRGVAGTTQRSLSLIKNTSDFGGIGFDCLAFGGVGFCTTVDLNADSEWVAVGDLNNSGLLDIAVTHRSFQPIDFSILINEFDAATNSEDFFSAPVELSLSDADASPEALLLVDLDGDGDLDVLTVTRKDNTAVANQTPGELVVFENLTVAPAPDDFDLTAPLGGARISFDSGADCFTPADIEFLWEEAETIPPLESVYTLEIASAPSFDPGDIQIIAPGIEIGPESSPSFTLPGEDLQPFTLNTTHYWRIIADNGGGSVTISGPRVFTTQNRSDFNNDEEVDGADLAVLLANWDTDGGASCVDINEDGVVNGADLAILLANWTSTEDPEFAMAPESGGDPLSNEAVGFGETPGAQASTSGAPWIVQHFGFNSVSAYVQWIGMLDEQALMSHIADVLNLLIGD